ncbi:hypothetical protein BLNAU_3243 [Blattamonas nauphoetae]|uniref:Uncharacterized protein n=1 Tax=Blattamonas nauphoetae TaxID=2049346 RepID=A0ABQ9YDU0_9EUKA|nr:hypothetical protein BLNAU_3243 [Blattamonas nauphoetae]
MPNPLTCKVDSPSHTEDTNRRTMSGFGVVVNDWSDVIQHAPGGESCWQFHSLQDEYELPRITLRLNRKKSHSGSRMWTGDDDNVFDGETTSVCDDVVGVDEEENANGHLGYQREEIDT